MPQLNEQINTLINESNLPLQALVIRKDKASLFKSAAATTIFPQYSITKSILALAFGFACQDHFLTANDLLLDFFPEKQDELVKTLWQEVTIKHLLTMSLGQKKPLFFREERQHLHLEKTSFIDYSFASPVVYPPGSRFLYSNVPYYLLGLILQRCLEKDYLTLENYLQTKLFSPLDIAKPNFEYDPAGHLFGSSGLQISTLDLSKIAGFCLDQGFVAEKPLLNQAYLKTATTVQIKTALTGQDIESYGYSFWLGRQGSYYMAGIEGQLALILPTEQLCLCCNSKKGQPQAILNFLWDQIIPLLRD